MIKGIKFATVPTSDQDRALAFWTEKVGILVHTDQPFSEGQRWIELRIKGSDTGLVLFTPEEHKSHIGGFAHFTFYADNVEKTYEELSARGVEFLGPPQKADWGTSVMFKDPDGNTFHLGSR